MATMKSSIILLSFCLNFIGAFNSTKISNGFITEECEDQTGFSDFAKIDEGPNEDSEFAALGTGSESCNTILIIALAVAVVIMALSLIGCEVRVRRIQRNSTMTTTSTIIKNPSPVTTNTVRYSTRGNLIRPAVNQLVIDEQPEYDEIIVGQETANSSSGAIYSNTKSAGKLETNDDDVIYDDIGPVETDNAGYMKPTSASNSKSAGKLETDADDVVYDDIGPVETDNNMKPISAKTAVKNLEKKNFVRPGDTDSMYADVLNVENNQVVPEYDYIRFGDKKV